MRFSNLRKQEGLYLEHRLTMWFNVCKGEINKQKGFTSGWTRPGEAHIKAPAKPDNSSPFTALGEQLHGIYCICLGHSSQSWTARSKKWNSDMNKKQVDKDQNTGKSSSVFFDVVIW